MNRFICFSFVILCQISLFGQNVTGHWKGKLNVQGTQLTLIFNIGSSQNELVATLDSPDQGAKGVPSTSIVYNDPELKVEFSNMGAVFQGTLSGDSLTGAWKQSGLSFPLIMVKQMDKEVQYKPQQSSFRPQEPKKPYGYDEEEVIFNSTAKNIQLSGTLTKPKQEKKCPAVILISGSGPQNRNQELFGHKPFLVLANHLTKHGVAVLRFDDRGVDKSTGVFNTATTKDFADDVAGAVEYLLKRNDIDSKNIGLVGHSEGAIIAPMIASHNKNVGFIVLLAGTGTSGKEVIVQQSKKPMRTFDVPDEKAYEKFIRDAVDIASSDKDVAEIRKELTAYYHRFEVILKSFLPPEGDVENLISQLVEYRTSPWSRYFYNYDPTDELQKVKCPVLSLNGSSDIQVIPKTNQDKIRNALTIGRNKDFVVKELEGLNHFFQECQTCTFDEYRKIDQTISPVALDEISSWIVDHLKDL